MNLDQTSWENQFLSDKNAIIAHERLAIVDPTSGKQPLFSDDNRYILAANGEIYNHREIRKRFKNKYRFKTNSDCEVILALFKEKKKNFFRNLGFLEIRKKTNIKHEIRNVNT